MKKSTITLTVDLDDKNVPEKILWEASDKPDGLSESKSVNMSLWDHHQKNTLRIDLWTKDMPIGEMKKFYIDCLGGLAQSALTATGDEYMSNEIKGLCEKLAKHVEKEIRQGGKEK